MNAFSRAQTNYDSQEHPMYWNDQAPIELGDQQLYELMAQTWVKGGRSAEDFDCSTWLILDEMVEGPHWSEDGLIEDMAATWIENGGEVQCFMACTGEIRGWIVAEMMIRGRF